MCHLWSTVEHIIFEIIINNKSTILIICWHYIYMIKHHVWVITWSSKFINNLLFFYAMGQLYRNENVLALSLCDPWLA